MTKARDLADLIAAGNPLADGAISVSEISDLTATAADLNATNVTTLGTVEASKVVTADVGGDVKFPDGDKAIFGAGDDLQIYHDGSNSYIKDAGTGNLVLQSNFLGVHVQSSSGENMAQFNINDAVKLYFDSVKKLETTATGIDVTGNATFGDNGKALFGAGSDLQIYHNGSDSYVRDEGTGSLILQGTSQVKIQSPVTGENYAIFNDNGAVTLNYNNNLRFATNDLGADVTGEFIADSYNETYAALSGTSPAVNCETGNVFALSTSGNTTFTFTNPPASGTAYGFTLKVTAGGTHTLTWPSSVDWAGGTAPDAPASGETNVLVFITHDGGTTWYGFQAGAALA